MVGCIENSQVLYIIYIYTQQILYIRSFTPLPPPKNIQKQNEKTKQDNKNKNKRQTTFGCIYVSQ